MRVEGTLIMRCLFGTISLLSLLLCLGDCVLLAIGRSATVPLPMRHVTESNLSFGRGTGIMIRREYFPPVSIQLPFGDPRVRPWFSQRELHERSLLGFTSGEFHNVFGFGKVNSEYGVDRGEYKWLSAPPWFVPLLTAALPVAWLLIAWRRRRRLPEHSSCDAPAVSGMRDAGRYC